MNSVSSLSCFLEIAVGTNEFVARNHFPDFLNVDMGWKYRCLSIVSIHCQGWTQLSSSPLLLCDPGRGGAGLPSPEDGVNAV